MKKLLLCAAIAVFGLSNVNAQEETTTGGFAQGDIYASGTVGFSNTKVADFKSNEFTFSPSVGYFLSDNIALELDVLFGSGEDFNEDKTTTLGAGLGAMYFFTPAKQFSFTLGAGAFYNNSKFEPNGGGEEKVNTFGFAVAPGLNYFVSDCIALRASIGALSYTSAKEDADGAEAVNTFGLNLDLSDINFGITYKF
jgi:opacity protein-like surface antigen